MIQLFGIFEVTWLEHNFKMENGANNMYNEM